MNGLNTPAVWRLISLASVAVAFVLMAPSCFTSDECRPDCEVDETGGTETGTGTGETGDPR